MQKEEYKYIRNLAWNLLIDAKISSWGNPSFCVNLKIYSKMII